MVTKEKWNSSKYETITKELHDKSDKDYLEFNKRIFKQIMKC